MDDANYVKIVSLESKVQQLQAKVDELTVTLEHERKIHLKVAFHADRLHLQLQAIREAAIGELCGLIADGPENLEGLQERE